jgi:hypothetical protein
VLVSVEVGVLVSVEVGVLGAVASIAEAFSDTPKLVSSVPHAISKRSEIKEIRNRFIT